MRIQKTKPFKFVLFSVLLFTAPSCQKIKDTHFEFVEYTKLKSIRINDVIVGPDVLSVVPVEPDSMLVQAIELSKGHDTVYINVKYKFCDYCYPSYDSAWWQSNIAGGGVISYYSYNAKRIKMEYWPVHNGYVYLSYLNASGGRTVEKIFVARPSYITGFSFDPPIPVNGDTMYLPNSNNYSVGTTTYYYAPVIGSTILGDTIKYVNAGVNQVNDGYMYPGTLSEEAYLSSGPCLGSFWPEPYNTKLRFILGLGSAGNWRVLDDTIVSVNFHAIKQ